MGKHHKMDSSRLSSMLSADFRGSCSFYVYLSKPSNKKTSVVKHVYTLGRYLPTGGLGHSPVTFILS